jgi:hypothetical protein
MSLLEYNKKILIFGGRKEEGDINNVFELEIEK